MMLLLTGLAGSAQTYNSPESIEFDYANNRWLIANNSGNNILQRNSTTGALTLFANCTGGPHGIEIVGDTLYVCAGANLKLFNINTAAAIGTISMGATFLNGITHDNTYLYATDFTAKKIYRVNIATRAFSVFVTGLAKSPNGIIYDQPNNRCVFVNWGASAPIMAVDVTTGATSTVTTTTLGNCDGIAKDAAGNYYVSSWTLNGISKFNNTFTGGPTTVVTGLNSPADIFYNVITDTLGVPNSGTTGGTPGFTNNTSYHYFGSMSTSMLEQNNDLFDMQLVPNPANGQCLLRFHLPVATSMQVSVLDVKGALVKVVTTIPAVSGPQEYRLDTEDLAPGVYYVRLSNEHLQGVQKLVITR